MNQIKYNYCTIFDSSYASRGLALYDSLMKHTDSFHLYIFAFDDLALNALNSLNLEFATIVSLQEFETPELLNVKGSRSRGEYCWTCKASALIYCLDKYSLPDCSYLDADLYFFNDPKSIHEYFSSFSVLLTPHFFTPAYDQTLTSGYFCAQFFGVKNDSKGRAILDWWEKACIEWCFGQFEEKRFGDQKYLEYINEHFDGVLSLSERGFGVAPWNVQQWSKDEVSNIIFFHFHALKLYESYGYMGFYNFPAWVQEKIYRPYIKSLKKNDIELLKIADYKSSFKKSNNRDRLKHLFLEKIKRRNNTVTY